MKSIALRVTIALILVALGWVAGRAQTPAPQFRLEVDAPGGWTTIICRQGCVLQGGHDEGNPRNRPISVFKYGGTANRCSAGINGWLKQ